MGLTSTCEGRSLRGEQQHEQPKAGGGPASPSSTMMKTVVNHHHLSFGIGGVSDESPMGNKFGSSHKVRGTLSLALTCESPPFLPASILPPLFFSLLLKAAIFSLVKKKPPIRSDPLRERFRRGCGAFHIELKPD